MSYSSSLSRPLQPSAAFCSRSLTLISSCFRLLLAASLSLFPFALNADTEKPLEAIRPNEDGTGFVRAGSGEAFTAWGVNYDHDRDGRLLEAYWEKEWPTVVEDFREIKALGANVVRIHLQVAAFMDGEEKPNPASLMRLAKLVHLAEETRLYLDLTGLGCYDEQPVWYAELDETRRWSVQSRFWEEVAKTCRSSPSIFCYDLMNEPILPGKGKPETDWLAGEFGGKHFVQRITLDLAGRTREEVAEAWVRTLARAIRTHDAKHMITVGVIPWALVFPGAKPLFYSERVRGKLDFASVHFYPQKGKIAEALKALSVYEIGKPLVVEETFPLRCDADELLEFIERSRHHVDGWISFYWGATAAEYERKESPSIGDAITKSWLERFRGKSKEMTAKKGSGPFSRG